LELFGQTLQLGESETSQESGGADRGGQEAEEEHE